MLAGLGTTELLIVFGIILFGAGRIGRVAEELGVASVSSEEDCKVIQTKV